MFNGNTDVVVVMIWLVVASIAGVYANWRPASGYFSDRKVYQMKHPELHIFGVAILITFILLIFGFTVYSTYI